MCNDLKMMRKQNTETANGRNQVLRQTSILRAPTTGDVMRESRNKGGHHARREGEVHRLSKGDSSFRGQTDALKPRPRAAIPQKPVAESIVKPGPSIITKPLTMPNKGFHEAYNKFVNREEL